MPTNAGALANLENFTAYAGEGASRIMPILKRLVGATYEADNAGVVVTRLNNTNVAAGGEVAAWTNAAVRLYAVIVQSPSTATTSAHVQIYNTSTASVTLGTTRADVQFKVTATKTKTVLFVPGNDDGDFSSAMSYCVSTAAAGATGVNAANTPVVTFLTNK